jgi:hypothetical protein
MSELDVSIRAQKMMWVGGPLVGDGLLLVGEMGVG